ncbi:MAG: hypothetical protein HCA25_05305 [Dolichospermum sp. DET50]|nr:hypothetical protein [Dolichospermum sp. DET66]MBS3031711.1 hypothetical protein [Dolichospermum sp. DET67]MBS3036922.1 hypothetical protein [Dolichospermum sp. DET50]QSX68939.1 MAG: hypothetical protein EZY12_04470 [Dolichospermum sp. DET69]
MDSAKCRRYQTTMGSNCYAYNSVINQITIPDGTEQYNGAKILKLIHGGKIFMVNSRRKNGLILFKEYYAEFAGLGAAIGGDYDSDCQGVLPIGNLSLLTPESHEDRQKAYLIRRQWIRLIKQITESPVAKQRVQKILDQFDVFFPAEIVGYIPDEAFAMLVGVLTQTVTIVRRAGIEAGADEW